MAKKKPDALQPSDNVSLVPPPDLPEDIYIESPQHALSMNYYYAVAKGRLWRKTIEPGTRAKSPVWEIWGIQGLPGDLQSGKSFPEAKSITAIYADGDAAAAVDFNRRIYTYQTRAKIIAPNFLFNWYKLWGAPFGEPIYLPEEIRDCAFIRRSAYAGVYLEDPLGNVINTGGPAAFIPNKKGEHGSLGLIHIYTISQDGNRLNYSDTGLPSGFGYQFGMPLRGRFIARGIAASCSIVFLIGETGRMYTALRDFDVSGNNPMMFIYTYKKIRQELKPGQKVPDNFLEIINLPMEPWRRQPDINLEGKAVITRNIGMITTGEGNAARQLRIQGLDRDGRAGFYYKQIFDEKWKFRDTGETFMAGDIIDTQKKFLLGPLKDMSMAGEVSVGGVYYKAEILQMNFTTSPARVELKTANGQKISIILHMVDGWTMLPVHNPGRDGMPKLFWGTLELPQQGHSDLANENLGLFDKIKVYDRENFAFHVMATSSHITIKSLRDYYPRIIMVFKSDVFIIPEVKFFNNYLAVLDDEDNTIPAINLLGQPENGIILNALRENRLLTKEIKVIYETVIRQALLQAVGNRVITFIRNVISFIATQRIFKPDSWTFTVIRRMFSFGAPLMEKRAYILWDAAGDLREALQVISARIKDYKQHLDYRVRRQLAAYLGDLAAAPRKYLCSPALKECRGLYTDMAPLAKGEEFFYISNGKIKMRAVFNQLIRDVKKVKTLKKVSRKVVHNLTLFAAVQPESLPEKDRQAFKILFAEKISVAAQLIIPASPGGALPEGRLFSLIDKHWSRYEERS